MNLTDFSKNCMNSLVWGSLAGCVGYISGEVKGFSPVLSAKAHAITVIVASFFIFFVKHSGPSDATSRNRIYIAGSSLGGVTLALVFKNLGLFNQEHAYICCATALLWSAGCTIKHLSGKYSMLKFEDLVY